ncbi:MAG: 1-deoxy-D-xylulose-5-phosphate synthase [Oscillospiraceae bacterium]|nr:1-deoxy-D-xylulose-5-phosphate synthase [Oscillospiraceae bacterium]
MASTSLLKRIHGPSDLAKLGATDILALCDEIREELISVVSENGGHLASNLGVVELTVMLLRTFLPPKSSIIFDVGHQSYVYKMLTGRVSAFDSLRKLDGISGFPRPYESDFDLFSAGHSGTALSSAIGLARAKLLDGDSSKIVAVIGDGSFGSGMVYEAMNTISDYSLKNLIVILNDNSMSISKSVGGLAQYLLRLRTDIGYSNTKRRLRNLISNTPIVGEAITGTIVRSKALFRRSIYDGRLFEEFGFNYIGPIDGHDIFEMNRLFRNLKDFDGPLLVHTMTTKGKGFPSAEANPGAYHGVGKFDPNIGNDDISDIDSFSNVFGRKLAQLAERDNNICAITAAMKYATGLNFFKHDFKDRFFDVGIAEEHAVTFAAGLAKGGKKPVFAVYSTFLQRAYDQLFQDVSLDKADVLFAVDRAGLVGEDGETHHGIYDPAILSSLFGFTVVSPSNYMELELWLDRLMNMTGPRVIRYPRGSQDNRIGGYIATGSNYDLIKQGNDTKTLIVSYGRIFTETVEAKQILNDRSIDVDLLKLNIIIPIDIEAVMQAMAYEHILFVEEAVEHGSINESFLKLLVQEGFSGHYDVSAINAIPRHGTVVQLLELAKLDAKSIAKAIERWQSEETS